MDPAIRAVIFANGEIEDIEAVRELLRPGDRLISADGGLRHLTRLGLVPDLVVGDLDSLQPGDEERLRAAGVTIERYPVQKDETDLELALVRAAADGSTEILIAGGLGGRLDQTLGNLFLLTDPRFAALRLSLDDGIEEVTAVRERIQISGAPGDRVSLLPLNGEARGVRTDGLAYPLHGETLFPYRTRGISNEMLGTRAEVSLTAGILLCVHTRMKAGKSPRG